MIDSIQGKKSSNSVRSKEKEWKPTEFKELPTLTLSWKMTSYNQPKLNLIPINFNESNGGRFNSLDEGMQFIYNHCIKYHGSFKRNYAHKYAEMIEILDPSENCYIQASSFPPKDFNKSFTRISRRLVNKLDK